MKLLQNIFCFFFLHIASVPWPHLSTLNLVLFAEILNPSLRKGSKISCSKWARKWCNLEILNFRWCSVDTWILTLFVRWFTKFFEKLNVNSNLIVFQYFETFQKMKNNAFLKREVLTDAIQHQIWWELVYVLVFGMLRNFERIKFDPHVTKKPLSLGGCSSGFASIK